jgi:hypothetical protein
VRGGLAQQLGPDPQQPVDQRAQVLATQPALSRDGRSVVVGQVGLGLHQVGAAADGGQLVGGQVVVHVRDVDEKRLAAQEPERDRRPGGLDDQRADPGAVVGDGLAGALEHVRGVVPHQVPQPVVVLPAVPAVELHELIQPGPGLVAVANAELEDVQLLGQRPAGVQVVPDPEQLQDQLPGRLGVARVALPAGQRLLVLAPGGLLPVRQRLPVQRVETPQAAVPAAAPRLQVHPGPGLGARERLLDALAQVRHVDAGAAAQVEGDLDVAVRDRPGDHGVAEVLLVLDPVADHAEPGEFGRGGADGLQDRAEGRPGGRGLAQSAHRAQVNVHGSARRVPRRPAGPGWPARARRPARAPRPPRGSRAAAGWSRRPA